MDILQGLNGQTAPAATPEAKAPPVTSDSNPIHPILADLVSGKIPGISIPVGFKNAELDQLVPNPKVLTDHGIKFFRPMVDKTVALAVVSPKFTDKALLQKADEAGRVTDVFPSIVDFFPHEGEGEADSAPIAPGLTTPDAAAAPEASAPSATPVPIVRPGGPQNAALARARLANVQPGDPSSRPIPGGGLILNSLIKKTV